MRAMARGSPLACCRLVVAKGRRRNEARDVAIYLAREHSGCRRNEIGSCSGDLSPSAASHAHRRITDRLPKSRRLRARLKELGARLDESPQGPQ